MSARVHLIIDQGADFSQEIQLYDDNDDPLIVNEPNGFFTHTAESQMRKSYQTTNAVTIATSISNGMLILSLPATTTTNIVPGRYVYDVKLTDNTNTLTRIVEGIITVRPEATRG